MGKVRAYLDGDKSVTGKVFTPNVLVTKENAQDKPADF